MKQIASYNSSFPLAYYAIGEVYSFYGQSNTQGTPATELQIQRYAPVLDRLTYGEETSEGNNGTIRQIQNGIPKNLNRFYAVVIDKKRIGKYAFITVMIRNLYNGRISYFTKNYGVSTSCMTDNRELMPASSHVAMVSEGDKKIGGITAAGKGHKVGGITRYSNHPDTCDSIGGITRFREPAGKPTVGGITRIKK